MLTVNQPFDEYSEAYDEWYDSPVGKIIFTAELQCLKLLNGSFSGRWMEIGVGTGRFASTLGICEGIDPSLKMLNIAAGRGIHAYAGQGEQLPFEAECFDGLLLALSLCFMPVPGQVLDECFRVLKPDGRLLLGVIAAESDWGRLYLKKKTESHPIYSSATFRSASDIIDLVESCGFNLQRAASTLFWKPDAPAEINPRVDDGVVPDAGFLGLLFGKNQTRRWGGSKNSGVAFI